MKKLIEQGDRVYVLEEIEAHRSVNPNATRHANEVIIFGFNKRFHPKLYEKYKKEVSKNVL
ncbi:MAG: hypothetical protein HFG91_08265 [Acholeplasmatales bacterium]|jgi:hypothetical protein|nr:hypothetical protein [Acholeplasmatales bacterium]